MTHSVLSPSGIQARHIDGLWWFIFWVSATVFVLVIIFLLAAILRRRQLVLAARPLPVDPVQERRLTRAVASSVAVTIAILLVFLIANFFTEKTVSALSSPDPITIEVIGHQWWWELHYTNADSSKLVRTANEMHIPVGVPVRLKLYARDVIHSFWVPALNGKRDLIPGKENELWIQADTPGTYEGQCAEFCGFQHAHMRLLVIAEASPEYSAWLDAQLEPGHSPDTPEQMHGQQVFLSGSCILCHTIQGTPAAATNGPNLTHLGRRQTLAAATIPNTRGHLAGWVIDPQTIKPGNHMPPNNFDGNDLQDLLAYLENLK